VASRLSPETGIDDAIAVAAAVGAPLRIAGDGPERERLEALAGDSVEFLGKVPATEVRSLLDGAAAVLMPSRYHEFAPYSALEAAGRGVPVVATAMGGLPEIVGHEACVPLGDEEAFTNRVRALWSDPGLRAAEGDALLERTRGRHDEDSHVRALLELYARLG
jgi:glycosyltransferase involved in cell wall biosynthesis